MRNFMRPGVWLAAIAVSCAVFVYREFEVSSRAGLEPSVISATELVNEGVGSNLYVELGSDFVVVEDHTHQARKRRKRSRRIAGYLALVVEGSAEGQRLAALAPDDLERVSWQSAAESVDLVLKFRDQRAGRAKERLLAGPVRGVVVPQASPLESHIREDLAGARLHIPKDVIVLEVDRTPITMELISGASGIGAAALALLGFRFLRSPAA